MKNFTYVAMSCFLVFIVACGRALPPPPPIPTIEDIPHTRKSVPIRKQVCDSLNTDIRTIEASHKKQASQLQHAEANLKKCMDSNNAEPVGTGVCDQWELKVATLKKECADLIRKKKTLEDEMMYRCD